MAAKLYGGAYLTSFVDAVLDKLSSILEVDSVLNGNHSALELLRRLEKRLYEVGPVLDDAEQKQFTDRRVKKWLVDLQDALYFADDLLDEISTKAAIAATQRDPGTFNDSSGTHQFNAVRLCTSILLLVLHPNGRPFITFLGVASACFPVPFVGFARNKLKPSWSKLNLESKGTWSRMISRGVVSAWKTPSS